MARFSNAHELVVGDEVLTTDDLKQALARPEFEDPAASLPQDISPADLFNARLLAAAVQQATAQLKIQGGQSQGFDPELIERALAGDFERQISVRGGPVPFADFLAGLGLNADSFRALLRRKLMAQVWTDSVTGGMAGATGRVYVDRYIRPGTLYRRYKDDLATPDAQRAEEIGRRPAMVSLKRLVISSQKEGSERKALQLAEACREFLLSGAGSFDDLVDQYAPEDQKGEGSRLDLTEQEASRLLRSLHPGPLSAEFLSTAAPGDLSPVLRFSQERGSSFFLVYLLEGRTEAVGATPFRDFELQRALRGAISEENRDLRVRRGVSDLARTTRVSDRNVREILIREGGGR